MKKGQRITSFGWIWINDKGEQYAAQVGHEWNGQVLTFRDKRILRRLNRV